VWLSFALSFAIKVPDVPVPHLVCQRSHPTHPRPASVILAGCSSRGGRTAFLRFNLPMFPRPAKHFVPLVFVLAIIAIIYGAMVCMVQPT